MKPCISVVLAVACIIGLSGCGVGGASGNERVLYIDSSLPLTSLDPMETNNRVAYYVPQLLYTYLWVKNDSGGHSSVLEQSTRYDSIKHTYEIAIHDNAYFHDGRQITANDVHYSISRFIKMNPGMLSTIESMDAASTYKLMIKLKEEDVEFKNRLASVAIVPNTKDQDINYFDGPIGSGPFMFACRRGEDEIILEVNPRYFLFKPELERIVIQYVNDKDETWRRLVSGETDIGLGLTPNNYMNVRKYEGRFTYSMRTINYYSIMLLNIRDPLFRDVGIRKAMAYGVNVKRIIEQSLRGYGIPASGAMGVNEKYRSDEVYPVPYKPLKAIEILKREGWQRETESLFLKKDGREFAFDLHVIQDNDLHREIARRIEDDLSFIGVRVNVKPVTQEEFLRRFIRNDDFQAALSEFSGAHSHDLPTLLMIWSPQGGNRSLAGAFEDERVSQLLLETIRTKHEGMRAELLAEAEKTIAAQVPGVFLAHPIELDVMSKRFYMVGRDFKGDWLGLYYLSRLVPSN